MGFVAHYYGDAYVVRSEEHSKENQSHQDKSYTKDGRNNKRKREDLHDEQNNATNILHESIAHRFNKSVVLVQVEPRNKLAIAKANGICNLSCVLNYNLSNNCCWH